ncbi:MAG: hypothetical protein K2K06_00930 [Oscillospiraceae bacterium]|nr:hypothetical protein [Oscillospiraceae bacterium]
MVEKTNLSEHQSKKIITTLLIILIPVLIIMSNPLRRSEEIIRKKLLKATPIGTEKQDVLNEVNSHKNEYVSNSDRFIDVFIGEYYYPILFWEGVSALYKFDENNRLVDIIVSKELDGL